MALAEKLQQMGCQLGQGYAFSKAVNYEKATVLLRDLGQYADQAPTVKAKSLNAKN